MSDIAENRIYALYRAAMAGHAERCEKMQARIDRDSRKWMRETRARFGMVPLGRPKNTGFKHD